MNYYYDVILNWSEERPYNFYEWNDNDYLELAKKIPIFKIKHKMFMDIINNQIEVDEEFLILIKDKTLISGVNIINKIEYACLLTDNKSVIALEFNEQGLIINRSNLLIDDELNALEVSYNLKDYFLKYTVIEPIKYKDTLRQVEEAKKLITLELKNLYQNKDASKLKYLYYEYKKETLDDIKLIYQNITDDLNNNFNPDILKLYYIIKLSYHNV